MNIETYSLSMTIRSLRLIRAAVFTTTKKETYISDLLRAQEIAKLAAVWLCWGQSTSAYKELLKENVKLQRRYKDLKPMSLKGFSHASGGHVANIHRASQTSKYAEEILDIRLHQSEVPLSIAQSIRKEETTTYAGIMSTGYLQLVILNEILNRYSGMNLSTIPLAISTELSMIRTLPKPENTSTVVLYDDARESGDTMRNAAALLRELYPETDIYPHA